MILSIYFDYFFILIFMDLCLFTIHGMDGCHIDNYGDNLFWKSQNY